VIQLTSEKRSDRLKAVVALVDPDQIGLVPESGLEPLLKMVKQEDVIIRVWSIRALGLLGSRRVDRTGPLLTEALNEGGQVVSQGATLDKSWRVRCLLR
jgi:hypothetical protein